MEDKKMTFLEKANNYIEREMTQMYPELKGFKANLKITKTKKGLACRVTVENTAHKLDTKQMLTLKEVSMMSIKACRE